MPSRNVVKEFGAEQYFHVYNRGVEKRLIFLDDQDYTVFLGLLKKYLSGDNDSTNRHRFPTLGDKVELLAFCLMPNHFHLLLYQTSKDTDGITRLMRRLATGYVMYFNHKYKRVGGLFQGTYKASLIDRDDYLHHISRYIHLNPAEYKTWAYSSLPYYRGDRKAPWVSTKHITELFDGNIKDYLDFVDDYNATEREMSVLKWHLANDPDD